MSVHKKTVSRIGALLLALVMMLSLLPTSVLATGSEPTVVIAGSDFQARGGHTAGAQTVTDILTQMQKAGYTKADGFLFCGDYDVNYNDSAGGKAALQSAVQSVYGTGMNEVYVQGNHDSDTLVGSTLSASGAQDTNAYGVFVINEKDYMWYNNDEATIKNTADNLKSYLDGKRNAEYTKPIFVLSHLPLHYSMRTKNDGDGKYANYIFDVLNEAGAAGLNIIFLYGHDHSHGWDNYLGGAAVYLTKGETINIAQGSNTSFKAETLNFTYMNAGFIGYYEAWGADATLTMTVFAITGDQVEISRYSADGLHDLKSAGVWNGEYDDSGLGYALNTDVIGSPQTIALGSVTSLVTKTVGNVSVTAPGLTGLTATKKDVSFDTSVYSAYVSYDITPEGYTQGDTATVTVTLDAEDGFDTSRKVTVIDQTGTNPDTTVSIVDGTVTFTTKHFSTYDIAQAAPAEPTERTYTRVTSLDELVSGGQYLLIENSGTDYFMLPESESKESGTRVGFNIEATTVAGGNTITGDYSAKEWTFTASGSEWILSAASGDAYFANADGTRAKAVFSTTNSTKFTIAGSADNFTFKSGDYAFDHSSAGVINGYVKDPTTKFYIYRLTAGGSVDTSGGDWVTISDGQGKTIFRKVDSLTSGKKYLIVSSNQAGKANAVNLDGKNINSASVTIIADAEGNYIEAPANTAQWTYTNGIFQNVSNTGRYLRGDKNTGNSLKTTNESDDSRITWRYDSTNGLCETSKNLYISSSFKMLSPGSSSNRVYIYEEATLQTSAEYAKLTGPLTYEVTPGTSAADALAAVKAGIDVVTSSDKTKETTLPDDDANITWTLDSGYDETPGEYAVTISYKNKVLGTAKVVVPKLTVTKIEVNPMEGTVQKGASNYAKTGSKLTVTYSDGSTRTVDVTLGMLSGSFDKNMVGDYTGLTVTYGGKTVQNYTLHVTPKTGNNYPEYPHEGAVRVGKTGEGIDFQSSGIAKVELTATGVPVKKGADVIIMVDTSSSMSWDGRIEALRASLKNLMKQFQAVGADGEPRDIRVAIADFNEYSGDSNSRYYLASEDHLSGASIRGRGTIPETVYTGNGLLNAGAFVDANKVTDSDIDTITTHSGTNYDYAFDATYQLGQAILKQNAQKGEERDLFVIFMSDGAPFQYNYFSSNSNTANWNNWLQGTVTNTMWDDNAHNYFYNGSGNKHRMAEAIKGNPDEMYTVIRKDSTDNYGGQQYMTQLPGLGATMYSIGFCLEQDNQITVASMEHVLKNISSDSTKYYYDVDTADELSSAFTAIGNEIAYAATNARFVDTMGADYDLRMASSTYKLSDGTTDTITPEITVRAYDIYTAADGVAASEIGKRKDTSTVLETVTFNGDGTQAFSDKIGGGATNILTGGVICANTFWYNTTGSAVSIDTDGDGTNDYNLASETFYWKMGTINQTELALSYYVYLTGSMEGTRAAGSYPTNESATLHYTNWLGNEAEKATVSPVLAWKSANVSYAFYLVNEKGEIIVNQTTGQTGSFANKIAVTNPVVYDTVLLNTSEKLDAVQAASVLPEGYTLYDGTYDSNGNLLNGATYTVTVNSNSTGSWEITSVKDVATTYVVNYDPDNAAAYSKDKSGSQIGHDYTHTTVWFAVVWKVQALPDTVVIDYGLPVDISVLTNDMFGENGKLAGIGAMEDMPEGYNVAALGQPKLATRFGTTYQGEYGDATADLQTGVVRYKLNTMQVNGYERFAYAVNYTGATNPGYYYDTVTVIPATTIYYEDDFVTTKSYTWNNGWTEVTKDDAAWTWSTFGTTVNGTQDEDRPGKYSLTDANNIYGYDSANLNMSTFSMGSALKATVDYDNYAVAEFSFYGTGFDVISMTSNTTGTIVVKVVDASGKTVRNVIVDTYYGYKTELHYVTYTYTNGEWVKAVGDMAADGTSESKVDTTTAGVEGQTRTGVEYVWVIDPNADDSIYQVPVIKIENLRYGQYKVEISAMYDTSFDHVAPSYDTGSYDFYLDAIRIYDPANDGAADGADDTTIEDAYKADGEGWPSYFELRNMVIDNKTLGKVDPSIQIDGLVFIDGDAAVGDAQISDYKNYGPNNEIYLAPRQSVAFILTYPTNVDRVHIGIKAADGNTATYTITNIARQDIAGTNVKAGNYYASKTFTMNTATEMYYDLTGWIKKANNATQSDIIVISNTGNLEENNTTGILSLTNIKFTYTSDPKATDTVSDENGTGGASYRLSGAPVTYSTMATSDELTASDGTEATVSNEGSVYMTAEAAVLAVRGINAMYAPEEPELEAFEPEKLDVNIRSGEVKVGDKVKVVVRSSDDVDYITVNGKTITRYKTDRRTGERTWTVELRAEEAGEMAVEIIAYNEAELASEAVTVTAAVREKKNQRDLIRKLFDWLFG